MIPLVASALLSVAGPFAYKLASSLWNKVRSPSVDAPRADLPRDEFATVLQRTQNAPAASPSTPPLLLAATPAGLPLAGAPQPAPLDLQSAAGVYQRIRDIEAP